MILNDIEKDFLNKLSLKIEPTKVSDIILFKKQFDLFFFW